LFIVFDVRVSIVENLSQFSDLSLKASSFILESNSHLSDLSIDHGLSLTFHHGSQIFKLLGFAFLSSLISVFPFLNLLKKILIFLFL